MDKESSVTEKELDRKSTNEINYKLKIINHYWTNKTVHVHVHE